MVSSQWAQYHKKLHSTVGSYMDLEGRTKSIQESYQNWFYTWKVRPNDAMSFLIKELQNIKYKIILKYTYDFQENPTDFASKCSS